MGLAGVQNSVRESGLELKGARNGGGYSVCAGIAGPVTAGAATTLFTVMTARICGALVLPCLLMVRRETVVGLHLCTM